MQENQGKWMQVRRAVLMALTGAALALGEGAMAQATSKPPERMTYQGFIAGSDGVALGNSAPKNYDVIFRIYDSEGSNTPLWGEQQTVTVDKGYFSVLLGEGAAVTGVPNSGITLSSLFSGATASDRYVGFTVKGIGTGGADVDILPRVRLMTSPYAFLASRALAANTAVKLVQDNAGGADLLSGSGSQLTLNGNLGVAGANALEFGYGVTPKGTQNGKIGYGTFSGDSLDIVGAGTTQANRKVRFWSEGGVTFDGPITAPSMNINGAFSVNGTVTGNSLTAVGGINIVNQGYLTFASGQTKEYPLNGSIGYVTLNGKDTLLIQGGGAQVASRSVDIYSEGGLKLNGPMRIGYSGGLLELGYGKSKSDPNNGVIAYQTFSSDALDIVGAASPNNARLLRFWANSIVHAPVNSGNVPPLLVTGCTASTLISIKADYFIQAQAYVTASDRRIKDVMGQSKSDVDLDTIRRVRVTDYRLKESPLENRPCTKGVIAQEIQKTMPESVRTVTGMVPWEGDQTVIKLEWKSAEKAVSVQMASPHQLTVGDRLKMAVDGTQVMGTVEAVMDDKTFTISGMGLVAAPKSASVIGREVKDFLSVDYQQIYMTAVSALQEVDRRVQALEKREAAVLELEKKAARVDALERDVAELRKLVAALATPAGKDKASASLAPGPDSVSVAKAR